MSRTFAVVGFSVFVLLLATPVPATVFTVNTTSDGVNPGACSPPIGTCTLREAVIEANAHPGDDEIDVPAGTYALTVPGANEDDAQTGDLDLTSLGDDKITIAGAGSGVTIIDGQQAEDPDRVFDNFIDATLTGLTIRNGHATAGLAQGGAIYNGGTLTLTDVVITGSSAASGGGILSNGPVTMTNCSVSGNTAVTRGGGIESNDDLVGEGVTISGNTADRGGGISNDFTLTFTNVTVSGNTASTSGGGLRTSAVATLTNVTFSGNGAPTGGAIDNLGDVTLAGVIVANSTGSPNCALALGSTLLSSGYNLDSGSSCGLSAVGDLSNTDPQLDTLRDNGGPTLTHALLAGSPAIDAGSPDCPPPAKDQRGIDRPADGNLDGTATCDIGAVEMSTQLVGSTTTTTLFGSTTTTLPGCTHEPTFPSILCRLDVLASNVRAGVPPGAFQTALLGMLTTARSRTMEADQALAAQQTRRGKSKAAKAIGTLKKFKKRLRSRKAKTVPDGVRTDLAADADAIRTDLVTLRRSGR